jgi:hypothetical protein
MPYSAASLPGDGSREPAAVASAFTTQSPEAHLKSFRALVLVLATAAAVAVAFSPAAASQPGFAFLEVPAGARAAALGGAYASVARGAEAAFWNPAGLADFTGTQFTGTHTETYQHLRHEQVAVAGRMFGGGLAGSLRAMYSEPIPERDNLGNLVGSFGSHDLEFLVGYGRKVGGGMSLGFTAQIVRERIADLAASTWALGAGAAWNLSAIPGARASLSVHNVGGAGHYSFEGTSGQPVALPAAVHGGVSLAHGTFQDLTGLLALEARATRGRRALLSLGGELDSPVGAALRFGLRSGDDVASWSAGMGWRTGALRVDYAFVPSRLELEDTHRFSLSAAF